MYVDLTPIAAHHTLQVCTQADAVQWRDGSALALHHVTARGYPQSTARAVLADGAHWLVIDLDRLACSELSHDLRALPDRDAPGVIAYHLRQLFHNRDAFLSAAWRRARITWAATPSRAAA